MGEPMTKPLSPAAAAVLKEFEDSWDADPFEMDARALAAALRAAADQVVPKAAPPPMDWVEPFARWDAEEDIRAELLAIAAELERLVAGDEVAELTTWILKQNIEAKQLDD